MEAIVAGIFSLLAIWLQNHLKAGKQDSPSATANDISPISGERRAKLRRMALKRANSVSAPEPQQTPDMQVAANASTMEVYQPATTSKTDGIKYIKQGLIVFVVDILILIFGSLIFKGESTSTFHEWYAMFIGLFIPLYASSLIIFGSYLVLRSWLKSRA